MNNGFRPEAKKPIAGSFPSSAVPLTPSPECASNPATPADYLRFLTQFPNLHADLALNPALPPDLEHWIKGHPDPAVQTNLRIRTQKSLAPTAANNTPLKSAVSSESASEEQEDEDKFDATTLAGTVPPVTRPLSPEKETPPQAKAPFSPGAAPAAPRNPSPVPPIQVLPQPSAYPQGMPAAAYPPPASYPQSFPPAGSPGYQPVPGQYPRPRRKRRWLIPLIAVIAVLAVIGGGIGAYFAFAGFKHVGYDSPEELADALKASLDESDLIGIAQMSAPSEDVIVEDTLQLNKDLQKYISTSDSKSKGGSGKLLDKVSDLTDVMQNLELDTSGLSSKVEKLSSDISRINYSGTIDVKIKDRNKLKSSLDKLIYDNKNVPEKEKDLNQAISNFKELEKEGIDIKSRDSLPVMAVKEDGKWYYSVLISLQEWNYSNYYSESETDEKMPFNYGAKWANPLDTPSDSTKFARELSASFSGVNRYRDLFTDDVLRFWDIPERRLLMIYYMPNMRNENAGLGSFDVKTSVVVDGDSPYGVRLSIDSLRITINNSWGHIINGKNYSYFSNCFKFKLNFTKYFKTGKLQLVAKPTSQGLKLSMSGFLANLFNNCDLDYGNTYYLNNLKNYAWFYERVDKLPFLKPYDTAIRGVLGVFGSIEEDERKTEESLCRNNYGGNNNYDSDSDYDYDDYD